MIKRILVALDVDTDTPVATQFAIEIAQRDKAQVDGVAVIDRENISADSRGGGIGSMYYAEKLRDSMTQETHDKALELIGEFERVMESSGVPYSADVKDGVPFQRIVEDMKYHDLLVVGRHPHFFYSDPEKKTDTLVRVVKETIAPTFVVGEWYREVQRVLISYDGSDACARTMQRFAQIQPFGTDVHVEILNVYEKERDESELLLNLAQTYLQIHGFNAEKVSLSGDDPNKHIVEYAQKMEADVVVAGAHSVGMLRKLAFGSTTEALLRDCPVPLFLHH